MKLNFSKKDRTLIVKMDGDIDHHTSDDIRGKITKEHKRNNTRNMIFDFSDVTFMDSSGVGLVIGRYKSIRQEGGVVAVCNVPQNIDRIFNMAGLYKVVKRYNDIDAAATLE